MRWLRRVCCRTYAIFASSDDAAVEPRIKSESLKLADHLDTDRWTYRFFRFLFTKHAAFLIKIASVPFTRPAPRFAASSPPGAKPVSRPCGPRTACIAAGRPRIASAAVMPYKVSSESVPPNQDPQATLGGHRGHDWSSLKGKYHATTCDECTCAFEWSNSGWIVSGSGCRHTVKAQRPGRPRFPTRHRSLRPARFRRDRARTRSSRPWPEMMPRPGSSR